MNTKKNLKGQKSSVLALPNIQKRKVPSTPKTIARKQQADKEQIISINQSKNMPKQNMIENMNNTKYDKRKGPTVNRKKKIQNLQTGDNHHRYESSNSKSKYSNNSISESQDSLNKIIAKEIKKNPDGRESQKSTYTITRNGSTVQLLKTQYSIPDNLGNSQGNINEYKQTQLLQSMKILLKSIDENKAKEGISQFAQEKPKESKEKQIHKLMTEIFATLFSQLHQLTQECKKMKRAFISQMAQKEKYEKIARNSAQNIQLWKQIAGNSVNNEKKNRLEFQKSRFELEEKIDKLETKNQLLQKEVNIQKQINKKKSKESQNSGLYLRGLEQINRTLNEEKISLQKQIVQQKLEKIKLLTEKNNIAKLVRYDLDRDKELQACSP